MAYNGIQQIVYITSNGLILRYGHCDFAPQNDYSSGTESIVEDNYRFTYGLKYHKYIWNGSIVVDDGAYTKKTRREFLSELEAAATAQEWIDIQNFIDSHCLIFCHIDSKKYTKARARVQKAYDDTDITEALYDLIMAEIPTEDIP